MPRRSTAVKAWAKGDALGGGREDQCCFHGCFAYNLFHNVTRRWAHAPEVIRIILPDSGLNNGFAESYDDVGLAVDYYNQL